MADHNKPERITPDPGIVAHEIPQGAVAIGESHLHESSAVELRPIVTTTVAILLIVLFSDLGLFGLYKFWQAQQAAAKKPESPLLEIKTPHEDPKLQVDEPAAYAVHREEMVRPIDGYKRLEGGKVSIPVDEAMRKMAVSGTLPTGPDWTLRPDERMVGGVIMNPEQVKYANTPPSQASTETTGPAPQPPAATPAAVPAAAPAAGPAAAPARTAQPPAARPQR